MSRVRRETHEEYQSRMDRFNSARSRMEFYDTGLGAVLPDAREQRSAAIADMWEHANGPAPTRIKVPR